MAVISLGYSNSRDFLYKTLSSAQRCKTLYSSLEDPSLMEILTKQINSLRPDTPLGDLKKKLPTPLKDVFERLYREEDSSEIILKDFSVAMCGNPIFRSFRGLSGGVIFVKGGDSQLVFKWTSPWEMACHRIFTLFIKIINIPNLHIPEAKNLSKKPPMVSWLAQPSPDERTRTAPSCLILFAKAPGATLLDFISGRYKSLTPEQKDQLWHTLGMIAIIDLTLAHQDRLFKLGLPFLRKLDSDYGMYANLGNLMVDVIDATLHFSLIDNSSDLDIERIKYLRPFFQGDERAFNTLIGIMKDQIIESVNRATFPMEKTPEIHANLEAFKADIFLTEDQLKSGMKEMTRVIQEKIPTHLKLFKDIYPALSEAPKTRRVMSRLVASLPHFS